MNEDLNKSIKVFENYWSNKLEKDKLTDVIDNYIVTYWSTKQITPEIGLHHWLFIQMISKEIKKLESK